MTKLFNYINHFYSYQLNQKYNEKLILLHLKRHNYRIDFFFRHICPLHYLKKNSNYHLSTLKLIISNYVFTNIINIIIII